MDSILLQAIAALMLFTLCFTITRQLHMLQLNSYFNSRFFDYLKTALSKITVLSISAVAITVLLLFINIIAAAIFALISCAIRIFYTIYKMKTAKKKIAFTARVKRMYFTLVLLWIIKAFAIYYLDLSKTYLLIYVAGACFLLAISPFMAMLINIINSPAERSVKRWYINDAKRILKSMGGMKVIGITGSYGKTSTKYILGRLLSEKYNVTITPESYNTLMGVVRTVREKLNRGTEIFVVEMGAKKPNDIKEICDLVNPTLGIITSIGPQHLNTFGSIETVTKTKFELADAVLKNSGTIYLNLDNNYIANRIGFDNLSGYNYKGYGIKHNNRDFYADNISASRHGLKFDIIAKDRKITVTTKLLGSHNVLNILSAAAVAIDLGLSDTDICYAVERLEPITHRLEMKPFLNGSLLIDDAYNANPAGSVEAMRVLSLFAPMKRIAVTPGLVELGEKEYQCNFDLGVACAENCDIIILVGKQRAVPLAEGVKSVGFTDENLHIVDTFNDAAAMLRGICDKDTVVLFENDLPDNYAR